MQMKTTLRGYAVACAFAFALASTLATAQTIPPSCQQIVTPMKVCGADLVRYTEIIRPDQADATRKSVDDGVQKLTTVIRDAVRKDGDQTVAARCAAPATRVQFVPAITNIMTALSFGDAASDKCQEAYGVLVVPTLGQ